MGLDVTPDIPAGRQQINAYGDGGFKIAGVDYQGSVLVFLDKTLSWDVTDPDDVTIESLQAVVDAAADLDILIVGGGPRFVPPPKGLREALRAHGVVLEWMDTSAGCRTFSALLIEERRVAAALIAV